MQIIEVKANSIETIKNETNTPVFLAFMAQDEIAFISTLLGKVPPHNVPAEEVMKALAFFHTFSKAIQNSKP